MAGLWQGGLAGDWRRWEETDGPGLSPPDRRMAFHANGDSHALQESRIDQLHMVIPDRLRSDFERLHRFVKGQVFSLPRDGRGDSLRSVLRDIGKSIIVGTRLG